MLKKTILFYCLLVIASINLSYGQSNFPTIDAQLALTSDNLNDLSELTKAALDVPFAFRSMD